MRKRVLVGEADVLWGKGRHVGDRVTFGDGGIMKERVSCEKGEHYVRREGQRLKKG